MKRIMMMVAGLMLATSIQAAAVGWSGAGGNSFAGGSYSLFIIGMNGVESANQLAAIVAAQGLSGVDNYAFYKGGTVAANGATNLGNTTSGKTIEFNSEGGAAANTYTAFLILENEAGNTATFSGTKDIVLANNSTAKTWTFGAQGTNYAANSFTVSVPEPTSGLLLLLGMAGLALKRKRA